jgi:xanthosine utilization system XapX-like protein
MNTKGATVVGLSTGVVNAILTHYVSHLDPNVISLIGLLGSIMAAIGPRLIALSNEVREEEEKPVVTIPVEKDESKPAA